MIKHYAPNKKVLKHIETITQGKKVLELGPGNIPFKNATHFVGWEHGIQPIDKSDNHVVCDFNHHNLPFKDKEFDFVYCRHVLEDLIYPFRVMEEMKRVAKAGYIETPSPMAEIKKGIDGGDPKWRGYHHHVWYVWVKDNKLQFVKKYPISEYFNGIQENNLETFLENNSHGWNTYFLWEDSFEFELYQHGVDFYLTKDYNEFVCRKVVGEAMNSTDLFYTKI
jgi:hypothetical protein